MFIAGIVTWLVTGLLVGFIVSKFIDLHGDDPRLGFGISCGGAIVAAVFHTVIRGEAVSPLNLWGLLFAVCGAVIAVVVWHMVRSRFVSRTPYTRRSSY